MLLLAFFSLLAATGGVLLAPRPLPPPLAHWQDKLYTALPHSFSPTSNVAKAEDRASWQQHFQTLQLYSAWLSQPLVVRHADGDSDRHVAHDSWQQHIAPASFRGLIRGDAEEMSHGLTGWGSSVWQRLSVQMSALPGRCSQLSSSWVTHWLSKLPRLLPGSQSDDLTAHFQALEASVAEGAALKPELLWHHVVGLLQRASSALSALRQPSEMSSSSGEALYLCCCNCPESASSMVTLTSQQRSSCCVLHDVLLLALSKLP